jgi:hypothetical protein
LAGQTNGTPAYPESALLNSPVEMGLTLAAGQAVEFPVVSGQVDLGAYGVRPLGPEGNTNDVAVTTEAFGLSKVFGPPGGLVGVFLGSNAPKLVATPPRLDFSTPPARNQQQIRPVLQQVFYIGSGRTPEGAWRRFVAPTDATRLFLGVLDASGYNYDNSGCFPVRARVLQPDLYLTSPAVLANGAVQFSSTNASVVTFSVLATTNVALPAECWDVLGEPLPVGGGVYQCVDPKSTNAPQRFYQLRWPPAPSPCLLPVSAGSDN